MDEFPKWVKGVVAKDAAEEQAVLNGSAEYRVTKWDGGEHREVILPRKKE